MKDLRKIAKELRSSVGEEDRREYFSGECPVCGESLRYDRNMNVWYCEGCNSSWDMGD